MPDKPEFPASGKQTFSSFKQACKWAHNSEWNDFIAPSVEIGQNHKEQRKHRYKAWRLQWAILKAVREGWSLLAIPSDTDTGKLLSPRASVLTYLKEKNWLIAINSEDNFKEIDANTFNSGIKISENPVASIEESLGRLPSEPKDDSDPIIDTWENPWYDTDGDYLYGYEVKSIKSTIKFFIDDLGDDPEIYFVKVILPLDESIKAINWFIRAFSPK